MRYFNLVNGELRQSKKGEWCRADVVRKMNVELQRLRVIELMWNNTFMERRVRDLDRDAEFWKGFRRCLYVVAISALALKSCL